MENSTTIALSRLVAQQRAIDVAAGNIANVNTPGFHGARMVFNDWLLRERVPGQPPGSAVMAYNAGPRDVSGHGARAADPHRQPAGLSRWAPMGISPCRRRAGRA